MTNPNNLKTQLEIVSTDDSKDDSSQNIEVESSIKDEPETETKHKVTATRHDLQLSRRLFHMLTGVVVATGYNVLLEHHQAVFIIGSVACIIYLIEQIRLGYPEYSERLSVFTRYLLRAEERLKESAAIPYAIAILLTIISFPKIIAVASIYTLAIADPLSALIGIKMGKRKIAHNKSVEGSLAFFIATILCLSFVFMSNQFTGWRVWGVTVVVAAATTIFETIPLKLDDNLTIPIFTAFSMWFFCIFFNVPL